MNLILNLILLRFKRWEWIKINHYKVRFSFEKAGNKKQWRINTAITVYSQQNQNISIKRGGEGEASPSRLFDLEPELPIKTLVSRGIPFDSSVRYYERGVKSLRLQHARRGGGRRRRGRKTHDVKKCRALFDWMRNTRWMRCSCYTQWRRGTIRARRSCTDE